MNAPQPPAQLDAQWFDGRSSRARPAQMRLVASPNGTRLQLRAQDGADTPLTDREADILVYLARHHARAVTREELLGFYEGKLAKWQIPDDVVFVDAIPLGATGKMLKTKLREVLVGYQLPDLR